MFKRLFLALIGVGVLLGEGARADPSSPYSVVLLTENFPPFNMAVDGKNFAQENNIDGIAAEVVREMFKRANIGYSMTLRFPWDRVYKLALENPGYGVFSTTRLPEREKLFKWVGPVGSYDWIMLTRGDSPITLTSLEQARDYKVGAYKGDAIGERLNAIGLNPILMLRDRDNVKKLVNGQIDLWAVGDPVGRYLAKLEGVTGLKTVLRFNHAELYLALNKGTPDEVVTRLQSALDEMRAEGWVDAAKARYQ
ncbi:amino acid ABC transporter substrate-binding protein [Pseudomonas syringae]|uniref:Amino acid ABC transporter substrate-binding protein n=1 Tax=Pseudomonas syringae TaxID=317 RepID=A0A244EMY5_PSESX|nr:ABC transporter substrate-binding protein [Pseudomonas syringae]MCI3947845.1 transporter substrate-binding domain-containing protein [Pseudomonas syringae]OUM05818.1 amino acid ABC transporter substrate-binding protein [Pseudomonas syringae]